jgi:hypothetical protein
MNIIDKRASNPAAALDGTELVYVAQLGADAVTTVLDMQTFITNGFLLITTAASTYQTLSGMSSYLTVSAAASTYGTITQAKTEYLVLAASDESTALATGTGKVTFRMPCAFTVSAVRASLSTAQTSGSIFTVDINEGGTTILSTKLTIDNTEKTSTTAATPAVISDTVLADDAEITIDIDQVGDGTAKGLKVVLIGTRA